MINEWNALNQLINGQAHDRCYLRTTEAVAEKTRPSRIANTNYWLTFSFCFVFCFL